jgi:long-chain acyl-CoA synthetase
MKIETTAPSHNLVNCLLHWEHTKPDEIYLTQPYPGDRLVDYTWREVADQARRGATYLRSLNFPQGSSIGILGKNSAHWIIADLAIWMAGYVSVPLYSTLNAETAQYILQNSEAKLLILGKMDGTTDTWNDVKDHLPSDLPIVSLPMSPRQDVVQWLDLMKQHEPLQDVVLPDDNALATIVYTSGSTGKPKGVMHSFRTMTGGLIGIKGIVGISENDRMLSYLPLAHVAERAAVEVNSLYSGFRVYFAEALETFQADMKRARPTIFFSVPRLWTKFYLAINHKISPAKQRILFSIPIVSGIVKKKILTELGMDQVRFALTGAAPLPANIVKWYRTLGLELLEAYGMSEDFANSHLGRPGKVRIGYVGSAMPGVLSRISESGELEVKSPSLMLGYYKMPEQTAAEVTADGYFKTGDRGEYDEEGRLRITGRVKELFKTSKGKYIAPAPIENKFNSQRVEVTCVTGPNLAQPFILLMLALETRKALDEGTINRDALTTEFDHLMTAVNTSLEDHEKLAFAVVVKEQWTMENGFLTPTMKIKRNVIEERYLSLAEGWQNQRVRVVWEA